MEQASLFDLIGFAEASPAKTLAWLDGALDLLASEADCSTSSCALLPPSVPTEFLSKTCLAFTQVGQATRQVRWESIQDEDGQWIWSKRVISQPYWMPYRNSGMGGPTAAVTLNTSVWPRDGSVCSLSAVLETCDVPPKYFLSPTACRGILRRAAKRGRELPPQLQAALQQVAESTSPDDGGRTT